MMSVIIVTNIFDGKWPFAADHLHKIWGKQGEVHLIRMGYKDTRTLVQMVDSPEKIKRLVCLGYEITLEDLKRLSNLEELAVTSKQLTDEIASEARDRNISIYMHTSEGYWKESVAEFAVGLTICGLRRIPQLYMQMRSNLDIWKYTPEPGQAAPGKRGQQYADDSRFTNGTISGKRIRIVGAGNIASHYGKIASCMGADVAAYDPYARETTFDLSGMRREFRLEKLVEDAEIFAPMVPLNDSTRGLITSDLINRLPIGCLVILVTRAKICDMPSIRQRVINDEIALAADVFDIEPFPLADELIVRHNVVHTPHIAGRTRQANESYVKKLAEQFKRYEGE